MTNSLNDRLGPHDKLHLKTTSSDGTVASLHEGEKEWRSCCRHNVRACNFE